MRIIPVIGAAALLCSASSLAYAQDTETPPTREEMGARVSALAKGQRDAETKGIGSTVREWARALGNAIDGDDDGIDDDDDLTEGEDDGDTTEVVDGADEVEDDGEGTSKGLGEQVKALAQGERDPETKGIGSQVRELARGHGNADVQAMRADMAAARADAKAARDQAKAAREEAKAARGKGRS